MTRKDFQEMLRNKRLYQYEVAALIGISEFTLSRWLRNPSQKQIEKITHAVNELSKG